MRRKFHMMVWILFGSMLSPDIFACTFEIFPGATKARRLSGKPFYKTHMRLFPNWKFSWQGSGIALSFFLFLNVMVYINTKGLAATDGEELIGYPFAFYTHGGLGGWTFFLWMQLLIDFLIISSATIFAGYFFARNRSFSKLIIFLIGIFIAVRVAYILFPGF